MVCSSIHLVPECSVYRFRKLRSRRYLYASKNLMQNLRYDMNTYPILVNVSQRRKFRAFYSSIGLLIRFSSKRRGNFTFPTEFFVEFFYASFGSFKHDKRFHFSPFAVAVKQTDTRFFSCLFDFTLILFGHFFVNSGSRNHVTPNRSLIHTNNIIHYVIMLQA